ncbi:hypothetical protein [uncultured Desulfosarcina sp.]|uniref:hypothetical protein n=1 Tax=uncultured Desulfosarcina sp. TaxID=218289 RepID=UPI0029C7F5F2|nr:hypothetical protein [uncultured Desulfosarcina sp.]
MMSTTAIFCYPVFASAETYWHALRLDKPFASPPDAYLSPPLDTSPNQRDAYSPAIRDHA